MTFNVFTSVSNRVNNGDFMVIDLETRDPYLTTQGTDAHCRRWGGYVFRLGLYHPSSGEKFTIPWDSSARELLQELLKKRLRWVGANIKYDINWLLSEEVVTPFDFDNNYFYDILILAPLLDESQLPQFYSMDGQAKHYGLPLKPKDKLLEAALSVGIKCDKSSVMGELYRLPVEVVDEYLTHDLVITWAIFEKQWPLIKENKLERVTEVETRLTPVLAMMERQGTRVDVAAAEKLYEDIYVHIDNTRTRLNAANGGLEVPLNTSNALTDFILARGHKLPETPSSKPERRRYSTSKATLMSLVDDDPLIAALLQARGAHKIAKDFVKGAVLEYHHKGRIHSNINQMISRKGDSNESRGVRFGRLSMDSPNQQQIPKRDNIAFDDTGGLGTAMRSLYIAEDGCQFMASDFSSQEPRFIIHWAETWGIKGAKKIGDQYRIDPTISSHDIVAAGIEAPGMEYKQKRALAKIINLGKGYEMGRAKLIANLIAAGVSPKQADRIMAEYDRNFPHVSLSSKAAMQAAIELGYVRTYLGRKLHFNAWEPVKRGMGYAMPYDQAYQAYVLGGAKKGRSPIKRAGTYRAFNRIVQGSSADQTKMAMVELWYTHRILPSLQIHDELADSAIDNISRAKTYKNVMENVCKLTIPSLTEVKVGPNWASGKVLEAA